MHCLRHQIVCSSERSDLRGPCSELCSDRLCYGNKFNSEAINEDWSKILMIRVLVVHPTRLVCSLLVSVLDEEPNMQPVAWATTVEEALKKVETSRCNIILASAAMPDNGALELTKLVAETYPSIKVIITGVPESKYVILQYVMAGAAGYVLQDVSVDRLLENIEAAQEHKALVTPEMVSVFMDHIAELAHVSARPYLDQEIYAELTPRELEVLQLIDEGLTNKEIADRLYIEVGTVKNHVHNILRKLDVSSREDAAAHLPFIESDEDEPVS
jgi:DNA-binding NarL/FixJ family response regulator